MTFYLDEGADGEQLPSKPMQIRIRVDPETWQEVDAPKRSPAVAEIVEEFLREYPAEQRVEYQQAARRKKEESRRLREFRIDPRTIEDAMLIAWGDITSDRTDGRADASSFFDYFKHEGAEYLVDDLYCTNPGCRCREVHLLFLEYHAAGEPGGLAKTDDCFMATISLTGRVKIEHCVKGTVAEAQVIASAWQAKFGDDLGELKWRYEKVKEIARRSYPSALGVASPIQLPRRSTLAADRPGRNDPCPCGSGKKYKKCCGR